MIYNIETDRLLLSKPVQEDFNRYYEIHSDPETNLFNPHGPMDLSTARAAFNAIITHWENNGFGTWCLCEKEHSGFIIGFGGLDYRLYGDDMRLNLGYRFDKNYWGKGYATELASSAIEFGLGILNKLQIFAIVRPGHLASVNVLEKCKMKLIGELNDVPPASKSLVFMIEKNSGN